MNNNLQQIYDKELTQFDKNCINFLDVVSQQLSKYQELMGMSSEEIALNQIRAGLTLWTQTRQDYILNHTNTKDDE